MNAAKVIPIEMILTVIAVFVATLLVLIAMKIGPSPRGDKT